VSSPVTVVLSNPLGTVYATKLGLTAQDYPVGTTLTVTDAVYRSLLAAGYVSGPLSTIDLHSHDLPGKSLQSLLVSYAVPGSINGQASDDYSAGVLSRYDHVVLGAGLQAPTHANYASTSAIIAKVATLNPHTTIWGYIDAGVTTNNHTLATLQTQITQWLNIGAHGIFVDDAGYDYHVPRARLNAILAYAHNLGVGCLINAWNTDDVLGAAVDATYNPTGATTLADSQDAILLESWCANTTVYAGSGWATASDVQTRVAKARTYRNTLGVRIFTTNIVAHSGKTETQLDTYRQVCEAAARIWSLDASGIAATSYGATGADVGVVHPPRPQFPEGEFRPGAPVISTATQADRTDLGLTMTFDDAGTHTAAYS
jgi:hypothetical protein